MDNVRVQLDSRSVHEEALLAILQDVLSMECNVSTPETDVADNIPRLRSYAKGNGAKLLQLIDKDGKALVDNFNDVKGEVINKILGKLEKINDDRFKIAKSTGLDSILGESSESS